MAKLNQNREEQQVKWKMLLLGMTLAFIVNLIYISNMFAVGKFDLGSGELCFVKGIIQTLMFGIAGLPCVTSILKKKRQGHFFPLFFKFRKKLGNIEVLK
jgi:hypothetical protein